MKKFLLSLAVASMAMAANATVYVVGAADGLSWDLPGKAFEGNNNVYTFELTNASKFKVSTTNTTDWDSYNATAYATGNTEFTTAVANPGGETLPVEVWGEDQMLPYAGNYVITLDLNNMTMTAASSTPVPTEAPAVYVRGAMNDWSSPDTWKFQYNSADDLYYFICQGETAIAAGVEFKFADANWGSVNYSTDGAIAPSAEGAKYDLVYNKGNQYLEQDFSGIIYLKVATPTTSYAIFKSGQFEYVSGVSSIEAEEGVAVYYNLQGQKVANPDRGIFVKVAGGKAVKVVK